MIGPGGKYRLRMASQVGWQKVAILSIRILSVRYNKKNMRTLSKTFLHCLKKGFLSAITEQYRHDPDLSLEIRDNYINFYYKGNSLLNLDELFDKEL